LKIGVITEDQILTADDVIFETSANLKQCAEMLWDESEEFVGGYSKKKRAENVVKLSL
jgi:hypothetical protein